MALITTGRCDQRATFLCSQPITGE